MRIRRAAPATVFVALLALVATAPAGSAQCAGAGLYPLHTPTTHQMTTRGAHIEVRGAGFGSCDDTTGPFMSCEHPHHLDIESVNLTFRAIHRTGASMTPRRWELGTASVVDGAFDVTFTIPNVPAGTYLITAEAAPDRISVHPMTVTVRP